MNCKTHIWNLNWTQIWWPEKRGKCEEWASDLAAPECDLETEVFGFAYFEKLSVVSLSCNESRKGECVSSSTSGREVELPPKRKF